MRACVRAELSDDIAQHKQALDDVRVLFQPLAGVSCVACALRPRKVDQGDEVALVRAQHEDCVAARAARLHRGISRAPRKRPNVDKAQRVFGSVYRYLSDAIDEDAVHYFPSYPASVACGRGSPAPSSTWGSAYLVDVDLKVRHGHGSHAAINALLLLAVRERAEHVVHRVWGKPEVR